MPVKTRYIVGETFDPKGMIVNAEYDNGKSITVAAYTVQNNRALNLRDSSVTIEYDGFTAEVGISVMRLIMESYPTKRKYKEGEQLDLSGMVIKASFNDNSSKTITDYSTNIEGEVYCNYTEIIVTYDRATVSCPIEVTPVYTESEVPSYVNYNNTDYKDKFWHNYKSISIPSNVSMQVDLSKKAVSYVFDEFSGFKTFVGATISHIYRSDLGNCGYGQGYKLSLCERLIRKELNNFLYSGSFTFFVDALGDWYVLQGDEINGYQYSTSAPEYVKNITVYKDLMNGSDDDKRKKLPVWWLIKNNIAKGFNSDGYLVFIADVNKNYLQIIYDDENKIVKAIDGDGLYEYEIIFNYTQGYLTSIENNHNRRNVFYTYENSRLVKISDTCNNSLSLQYDGDNISQIKSSDEYLTQIYVSNNKNSSIFASANTMSTVSSVPVKNDNSSDNPIISSAIITFKDNRFKIVDKDENYEIYDISDNGIVSAYYQVVNSLVTKAEKYEYYVPAYPNTSGSFLYPIANISDFKTRKAGKKYLYKKSFEEFVFPNDEDSENIQVEINNDTGNITKVKATNIPVSESVFAEYEESYTYKYNVLPEKIQTVHTLKNGSGTIKNFTKIVDYFYDDDYKLTKTESYIEEEAATKGKDVVEYGYNNYGKINKQKSYNSLNSTDYIQTFQTSSTNSVTVIDAMGVKTTYDYAYEKSDQLQRVMLANNCIFGRTYEDKKLKELYSEFSDYGPSNKFEYVFDEVTQLSHGKHSSFQEEDKNKINFEYDSERRLSKVSLNNQTYQTMTYNDDYVMNLGNLIITSKNVVIKNAKGEEFEIKTPPNKRTNSYYYNGALEFSEGYNSDYSLCEQSDEATNNISSYTYDGFGNLTEFNVTNNGNTVYTETYTYDIYGMLTKVEQSGEAATTYEYSYEDTAARQLEKITINSATQISPKVDKLGRYVGREVFEQNTPVLTETVLYENGTQRPDSINFSFGSSTYALSYRYDECGNISRINFSNGKIVQYKYDYLNRLIREDNELLSHSFVYTYDDYGNILSKKSYTLFKIEVSMEDLKRNPPYYDFPLVYLEKTETNSYFDGRIVGDGQQRACQYDAIGNPIKYRGYVASWSHGRQLVKFKSTEFAYDGQGRRISKKDAGSSIITFDYDVNGRLIKSSNGFQFFYDTVGVAGFTYENAKYFYMRDIQGNIIAILDSSGNVVVEYTYDAWGNHTVSGSNTALGNLNPFRYRSYYYDTETSLYYLQTRYYDPEIGRFLNMDSIDNADPETIGGLNLYAYCLNNPINFIDDEGLFPQKIYIRIDELGKFNEHIHIKYNGRKYSWYKNGHKKRHSSDYGLENVSSTLKKKLKNSGISDSYFNKIMSVQLPKWQEKFGNNILAPYQEGFGGNVLPPYQEGFGGNVLPPYQEGFGSNVLPPYQEQFTLPSIDSGTIILIGVGVIAVVCVAAAFFTAGQSLWGLLAII